MVDFPPAANNSFKAVFKVSIVVFILAFSCCNKFTLLLESVFSCFKKVISVCTIWSNSLIAAQAYVKILL